MLRRRPTRPLNRRQPGVRIPAACKDVLSGTAAAGKLTSVAGETKLCEDCYRHLERNGAYLLGDGVALTREIG